MTRGVNIPNYNRSVSNIITGNTVLPSDQTVNYQGIEDVLDASRTPLQNVETSLAAIERSNFIKQVDYSKITTGTNQISVLTGAVVEAVSVNQATNMPTVITGFAATPVPLDVTGIANGDLVVDITTLVYSVRNLANPITYNPNVLRLAKFTNLAGVVTIQLASWQNSIGGDSQEFLKGATVYGNLNLAPGSSLITADGINSQGYLFLGGVAKTANTQVTFQPATARNNLDTANLKTSGVIITELLNTGINGIAQSPNLGGTVQTTAGSAAVTGTGTNFLTDFIVGDVISIAGNNKIITAITSNTALTANSSYIASFTSPYRRGGLAGTAVYYAYLVGGTSGTGFIWSTRNTNLSQALVDLPAGYANFRNTGWTVNLDLGGLNIQQLFDFANKIRGEKVLIENRTTTTSVSTFDISLPLGLVFSRFEIELDAVYPSAASTTLFFNESGNFGATFDATATKSNAILGQNSTPSTAAQGGVFSRFNVNADLAGYQLANTFTIGASAKIKIMRVNNAGTPLFQWEISNFTNAVFAYSQGSGFSSATGLVTDLRFGISAGTLAAGLKVRVYGVV